MVIKNKIMDNIRFLFFTNENGSLLGELAVKHFLKHNKKEGLKVSLVSNKFKDNSFQFENKISYLSGDIEFQSNGGHFAQTLLKVLPQIEEEYIFFFCDDYFFTAETKYNDLIEILNILKNDNIDYFCPDDGCKVNGYWSTFVEKYTPNYDTKFKDNLFLKNNSHQYLFSVQPCIWKKESLLNLLKTYDNISLHDLDNTLPIIKENNKLKCLISNLNSQLVYFDNNQDYFLIQYIEIIRHGCFLLPENGHYLNPNSNFVIFIKKLIDDEGLLYKPEFRHKLFWYYDKMMGTTYYKHYIPSDYSIELNFYVDPEWIKKFKKD
jgi:hypothetical protein